MQSNKRLIVKPPSSNTNCQQLKRKTTHNHKQNRLEKIPTDPKHFHHHKSHILSNRHRYISPTILRTDTNMTINFRHLSKLETKLYEINKQTITTNTEPYSKHKQ